MPSLRSTCPSTSPCPIQLSHLVLVAVSLDGSRQVADGDLEREVDRREQESEEDVPSTKGAHKSCCSSSLKKSIYVSKFVSVEIAVPWKNLALGSVISYHDELVSPGGVSVIVLGQEPVGASEETKRDDEAHEDDDKDDVGPE